MDVKISVSLGSVSAACSGVNERLDRSPLRQATTDRIKTKEILRRMLLTTSLFGQFCFAEILFILNKLTSEIFTV